MYQKVNQNNTNCMMHTNEYTFYNVVENYNLYVRSYKLRTTSTCFTQLVNKITETEGSDTKELEFIYGSDYGRRKTIYKLNGTTTTTKYYAFGNYEEEINTTSGTTKDYYIYGGDGVAAIYRVTGTNTTGDLYYIHKDNLGSFDKVTNSSGTVVDSYSFDAWGNRRDVDDWTTAEDNAVTHLFARGFTGHEHLDQFGLINMNGRCYDPLLGRMLSPDPNLQDPSNTQNYNRYSYCLNNPLKYTDPSGYNWNDCISTSFNNLLYFFNGSNYAESNQLWGSNDWDNMNRTSFFGGNNIGLDYRMRAQLGMSNGGGGDGNKGGNSGIDDKTLQYLLSSLGLSANNNSLNFAPNDPADATQGGGVPYSWDYIDNNGSANPADDDPPGPKEFYLKRNVVGGYWDYMGVGSVNYDGKAWFGTNFVGPGPDDKSPYELGLSPKDAIDKAAQRHDYCYWFEGASGITGALFNKGVVYADFVLTSEAYRIMQGYKNRSIDEVTGLPISERTYNIAKGVYYIFYPLSNFKMTSW